MGGTVTKDWPVAHIVEKYPQAAEVLAEYGLHCFGCSASEYETLEEGWLGHGFAAEDLENLVSDLNDFIQTNPARDAELGITKEAALAVKEVGMQENLKTFGLAVLSDPSGNFFMEFREGPGEGDHIFRNNDIPEVAVYASPATLQSIGGATIGFADGKFKLDVGSACDCTQKQCNCSGLGTAVPSAA
jgi:hybrid cluster-associated redox disulfide protein